MRVPLVADRQVDRARASLERDLAMTALAAMAATMNSI